jgi:hypothetical protein
MNDTIDHFRLRLSDHWDSGVILRNNGLLFATPDNAKTWKRRELEWAEGLYEIIQGIDAADVVRVKIIKDINGPIIRGEVKVLDGNPLLDDPDQSLLCHDTRLDRVEVLMAEYGARFKPAGSTARLTGGGRIPDALSERDNVWEQFDKLKDGFTFKRGEQTKIGKEIAGKTIYRDGTVIDMIRAAYNELKKKKTAK